MGPLTVCATLDRHLYPHSLPSNRQLFQHPLANQVGPQPMGRPISPNASVIFENGYLQVALGRNSSKDVTGSSMYIRMFLMRPKSVQKSLNGLHGYHFVVEVPMLYGTSQTSDACCVVSISSVHAS